MYTWEGMKKIDFNTALNLFRQKEECVYMLFDDNTEAILFEERVLKAHHERNGEFGIEI